MNYLPNFNETWWETCLRDGDSDLFIKGTGPFWGPIRGKIRKILLNLQKSFSHEPLAGMLLIFGMKHPWGKEIQVCSNEVPGVINGHALRGNNFI